MGGYHERRQSDLRVEAVQGSGNIFTMDHIPQMQELLFHVGTDTRGGEPFRRDLRAIGALSRNYCNIRQLGRQSRVASA
jgi:hypothetical protein